MKKINLFIAVTAFLFSSASNATVIDFEGGLDPLFTYTEVSVLSTPNTAGSGYDNVAAYTSSTNVAYNPFEASPSYFFWAGVGTFDLTSFVIAGAWGEQTLTVKGLNNGSELYSSLLPVTPAAQLFLAGWTGLDELQIMIDPNGYTDTVEDGSGQHWALDNLTINENVQDVPVPEPSTLALMGLGLAGIGFFRRRKV